MNTVNQRTPVAFAAPAQQILYTRYGDPRTPGWESKWMTLWPVREQLPWFPQAKIYIHKDFKEALLPALKALETAGLHQEIKSFDGCFNIRHVRGGYSVLSIHSWGAAIDLNARDNPMATLGKWSPAFIATMAKHGIYCGQSWTGRKDPMHFALVNG
jgi:hypothetical protein